ncbi:histidinol phosphate phosphatase H [Serendipita vermifera]|nr:histidinol phosphate phosphatase H [Serendipita vermifera]
MPYSHHSHSGQFCKHGSGTLESIVQRAVEQGFKMYSLTEHCPRWREQDLYPEEVEANVTIAQLEETCSSFIEEAKRLRSKYDELDILIGLETDHIYEEDLDYLQKFIQSHGESIDYIVGGVHHADGHPIDFSKEMFEQAVDWYIQGVTVEKSLGADTPPEEVRELGLSALLEAYFTAQRRLLGTLRPAVVAHFALPLLFTPSTRLASHTKAREMAASNIVYAISYGALFELSSAPFRKGWEEGWPGEEVVKMIIERGGKFCLSDDAHNPGQVGLNYHKLKAWITKMGVSDNMVWRLRRKEGGGVESVRCEMVWDDVFWKGKE